MSWADLFERAGEHETTTEAISRTLATVRAEHKRSSEGSGTDDA